MTGKRRPSRPTSIVEPGSAPEAAPPAGPTRLHLGDGVANFSREDHFHETPAGWLECEECVKALKGE